MTTVILTGAIRGTVTLQSGEEIDVRPGEIEVADEKVAEIIHLIGERYAAEGHPLHDPGDPFVHDYDKDFAATYEPHVENTTILAAYQELADAAATQGKN